MAQIRGVHHVALGVSDLEKMIAFYGEVLGFSVVLARIEESAKPPMRAVTRTSSVVFGGALLLREAGGFQLEMIRMTDPAPRPIRANSHYGDIGVNKIVCGEPNLERFCQEHSAQLPFCTQPRWIELPGGLTYGFVYCRDPEGNLVELVTCPDVGEQIPLCGARWVGISVTDLERSLDFYQHQLGLDRVVIPPHDGFSGCLDEVSGYSGTKARSCLLGSSLAQMGEGLVELFEVSAPRGRALPFAALWGDFGYLQTCFLQNNARAAAERLTKAGIEFLCAHTVAEGGPSGPPGEFFYIKDPDGIPLEQLYVPSGGASE
ncbi:MAG: VOC family protein [Peptococcaceae bacterium]|jgi:catechol 2,3-dioxygenase-like lactoylglutathione lyase family enzyme|nr:VOC family protein [Peptococcaceae bacterium]